MNDNFYVFGGQGSNGDLLCDLWQQDPTKSGWTLISAGGTTTANSSGVYPASLLGNNCGASSCMPGCRSDAVTWAIHSPTKSSLYLFGGYGYGASTGPAQLNDLWVYDTQSGLWTWLHGSNEIGATASYTGTLDPGARAGSASATIGSQLWLHGGKFGFPDPPVTPVAPVAPPVAPVSPPVSPPVAAPTTPPTAPTTPPTAPEHEPVSPPTSPPTTPVSPPVDPPIDPPVSPPVAAPTPVATPVSPPPTSPPVDPPTPVEAPVNPPVATPVPEDPPVEAKRVHGVYNTIQDWSSYEAIAAITYVSDTWYYDVNSNAWIVVEEPSASASIQIGQSADPGPRTSHTGFAYNGYFYVFGGFGFDTSSTAGPLNDLYMYDSDNSHWTFVAGSALGSSSGSSSLISARYDAASWIDSSNNVWFFGGYGTDSAGTNNVYLSDIWSFNPSSSTWNRVVSGTGSPASCTSNCGTEPHCENIGVSNTQNRIGARSGSASFWRRQSNYGSIFGGQGYDCTNSFHYLQDTWDIANNAPSPVLIRPTTLNNISASTIASGYTMPVSGSFLGYVPGTITFDSALGISSCTIDSTTFSATSLNCIFGPGSSVVSSGPLNGYYTSIYAINSNSITMMNIRPSLSVPGAQLSLLANSTGGSFSVTGAGFGTTASSLSASAVVNGLGTLTCSISSVNSGGVSFSCALPSTSSYSGPFTVQVTYTTSGSGAFSTDAITYGTIRPVVNPISSLPSNLNDVTNAPSSLTIAGNGFGNSPAGVSVSVTFGGADTRVCNPTAVSPTSITCSLVGGTSVSSAGYYSATVTSGGATSPASDLGALIPVITVPSTLPSATAANVPTSYIINGSGFSQSNAEMSVILTYPGPGSPTRTCTVSSTSSSSLQCTVTNPPSGYSGRIRAVVSRTHTGATSSAQTFSSVQTNIYLLTIVITTPGVTINANAVSFTVSGEGMNDATLSFVTHGSLSVPTCTAASTTTATSLTCVLSGVFLESGLYDAVFQDASGTPSDPKLNFFTVNPGVVARVTENLDSIKTSSFVVSGAGFGATGTAITVVLSNGAVCGAVTSTNPTSFTCTLTSAATTAGLFSMTVTVGSFSTTVNSFAIFRPMLVTSSYVTNVVQTPTLTVRGAAFGGNSVSAMTVTITGAACGANNTCICGSITVINGTALTCVLSGQRSSGSLNATLLVGSYPLSSALIGVLKPVVRVSNTNLVTTAKSVNIIADPSTGFGTRSEVVSVSLSSGTCAPTDVSTGAMTCTFATAPSVGALQATVTVNSVASDPTVIANVIAAPVITASPTAQLSVASSDVIFYGNNFGNTLGISVFLSTSAGQTCSPAFVNNTMIRCTPVATTGSALPPSGSLLRVLVTKDGGNNTPGTDSDGYVAIARMVSVPTVLSSYLSISNTASTLTIRGSSFSTVLSDVSVTLSLGGTTINPAWYSVTAVTNTAITLSLTNDWATFNSVGTISAVVTVARGSGTLTPVATLARTPTVTSSTADIAVTSTSIIFTGSGFQPPGVDPANNVIVASLSYGSSSLTCAPASGTDTSLTCVVPNNAPAFVDGTTVSVTTLTINGLSMASSSVQIGTFRAIPFIETATSPAFQLTTGATLSFSARSIPAGVIVTVWESGASSPIPNFCTGPIVQSSGGVGTITCESHVWSVGGPITAQIASPGGIKSVVTTVGFVRAPPTITASTVKIGRRTTSLTISGTNFSPFAPIGTQNALTLGVAGATGTITLSISSATATSLAVTFPTGTVNSAGPLNASITVAGIKMAASWVTIATVVDEPAPTSSEDSIPLNAASFVISGSALSFTSTSSSSSFINLVNSQGTALSCASVTPVSSGQSVVCNLPTGTTLPEGPVSLTAMTLDGVASLTNTIVVATALPTPVVTVSTVRINPASVTISGTDFSSPRPLTVMLSSSTCTVTSTGTNTLTCTIPSAALAAGPLYANVTVQNGVTSAPTLIGYVYPTVVLSTVRNLITSNAFALTGEHFSPDTSKVSVALTTTLNSLTQACTVSTSTLLSLRCTSTDVLYVGVITAVVTVTGSDGMPYASNDIPIANIAPVLASPKIYANVNSSSITMQGLGFASNGANGIIVSLFTESTATTTPISCNVTGYTYNNVTCKYDSTTTGGVYTAVISVDSGAGFYASDPDTALAIAPLVNEGSFGERRTLLALPDITTDTTTLDIEGSGFDPKPSRNYVQLSSGSCNVIEATTTSLKCSLADIETGTLSARVSTNAVTTADWVAVANVLPGEPREPNTPVLFPSTTPNSSVVDGGTGPTSRSSVGWTAGAIAGVVVAAVFAVIIILIVVFVFLVLRKNAGTTANRLLRAAKRGPNARTRSRSARSNTSSASLSPYPYPSSPGSVRRRDLSKLTVEEEDFVRRIAFADSAGKDGDLHGLASGDEYLFDSSSEYLYRESSESGDEEYDDDDYDEESGEELEEDVESGLQSEQDGASSTEKNNEEEEEYQYTSSTTNEQDADEDEDEEEEEEAEEESNDSEEESKTSSSSEYLYTSGSSEASSSK